MTDKQILIFTDLDGSLLDHHTYSWEPAKDLLERLKAANIPVILNSSKTLSEQVQLRKELALETPFIVENGGGVVLPPELGIRDVCSEEGDFWVYDQAVRRNTFLPLVHGLRSQHNYTFTGFSDMTPEEVADATDLPLDKAKQAADRHYSEPLLWSDSDSNLTNFESHLKERGFELLKGGRFIHVGKGQSKGEATRWLVQRYERIIGKEVVSIGLGDSQNDEALLNSVDYPVAIKAANGKHLDTTKIGPTVLKTKSMGPDGWVEGVNWALDQINSGITKE